MKREGCKMQKASSSFKPKKKSIKLTSNLFSGSSFDTAKLTPHLKFCILFAELRVFDKSMAMVIGPTPPRTGVMAKATLQASS